MTKLSEKAIYYVSAFFAAVLFFCLPSFAAETAVVPGPDPLVYETYISAVIDSFDDESGMRWTPGEGTQSVVLTNSIPYLPYLAFSGDNCLLSEALPYYDESQPYTAVVSAERGAVKLGKLPGCFGYMINLPDTGSSGKTAEYTVAVTLRSPRGDITLRSRVNGGMWTAVFTDISSWNGRSSVTGMDFSVTSRQYAAGEAFSFAIDEIAFFEDTSVSQAMRWLTAADNWYNFSSYRSVSAMKFTPNSEQFYIESYGRSLPPALMLAAENICLRLDNGCGAKTVTMQYTTGDRLTFNDNPSYTRTLYDGGQSVYFPIPEEGCSQIRFTFDGIILYGTSGYMDIISIYPTKNTGSVTASGYGVISSCTADQSGIVTVSGTLSENAAQTYAGYNISLFEIGPEQPYDVSSLRSADIIDSVRTSQNFTLKGTGRTGFLGDRYLAAIDYNDQLIIIGSSYITNPEALCGSPSAFTDISSLKGISSDTPAQTAQNAKYLYFDGASSIIIPLRIEKLYSYKTTSIGYNFNGTIFYFDASYIQQIDNALMSCRDSGASVWMRLTVSMTNDSQLNSLLCSAMSQKNSKYAAFNTDTREGISLYQAIFSFISERWSSQSSTPVSGYIIGYKVNDSRNNWSLGNVSLDEFTASYARAVRQAYLYLRASAGSVRLAISADCSFENGFPSDTPYVFYSEQFLTSFGRMTSSDGDFGWLIELVLNPGEITSVAENRSTSPKSGDNSITAVDITIDNYETFNSFLGRSELLFRSSGRGVIVNAGSEISGAEYAYSFFRLSSASCDTAKVLVISGNTAGKFETMFNLIDTAESLPATAGALAELGYSDWSEPISGFDTSRAVNRNCYVSNFASGMPDSVSGSFVLSSFDTSDSVGRIKEILGCTDAGWRSGFSGRSGLAMANFSLDENNSNGGIYYKFDYVTDLSKAPVITLDCAVVSLPEGTNQAQMTIMLVSGRSTVSVTGQISENGWQRAICDLTEYRHLLTAVDGIRIWISSYDGIPLGTPSLIADSITVWSYTLDSGELEADFLNQSKSNENKPLLSPKKTVYIMFVIMALCSAALAARIIVRKTAAAEQARKNAANIWKFD